MITDLCLGHYDSCTIEVIRLELIRFIDMMNLNIKYIVSFREFNDMVFASLQIHENAASIAAGKSSTPAIGSVVKARSFLCHSHSSFLSLN